MGLLKSNPSPGYLICGRGGRVGRVDEKAREVGARELGPSPRLSREGRLG